MGLPLKIKSKQNLSKYRVLVEDSSATSDEYFSIVEFPEYLGEGKNLLRIKTNPNIFEPNTQIFIEVLDPNGTPVYWEIPNHRENDNSRLISIWVYGDRTDRYNNGKGIGEIILLGTLSTTSDGNQVPTDFKKIPNVRWRRKVSFAPNKPSNGKIVFKSDSLPKLALSSSVDTFTNKIVSNNQLVREITGSSVYYKKSTFGNTVSLERDGGANFNSEMVGGIVYGNLSTTLFPRLGGGQSQPTTFTASITNVVSNQILRIQNPLTQSDNRTNGSIHTYEYSDGTINVNVEYYSTASDTQTQNQVAVANITLTNLDPIVGRVHSVNTLLKSQGLTSAEFQLISNNRVEPTSSVSFKVPIPTEQLNDPKTLKLQFLNVDGVKSETELIQSDVVFTGGNVYIAGDQSLITGSFHIGNSIGTGIEMSGHSSGYLKSVGYQGMTSASLGKGPGGFLIWSGSGDLQIGANQYPGVGMEMVSAGGSSSFFFTTNDGGNLKVITDEFFIGTKNTQFISGSEGKIEISSSIFHLDPQNNLLVIGADAVINAALSVNQLFTPATINGSPSTINNASSSITSDGFAKFVSASIGGFVITPTVINSSQFDTSASISVSKLALKSNGQITGSNVLIQRLLDGDFYTLFDTNTGIIDARNNGRQIISDYTEYEWTGSVETKVAEYYFQLMPGENRLVYAFSQLAHRQASGLTGGYVQGTCKMTLQIPNTGSVTNGTFGYSGPTDGTFFYDGFVNASEYTVFEKTLGNIGTNDFYSSRTNQPGDQGFYYEIPSNLQGRLIRANVYLKTLNVLTTGTRTAGTFSRIKGLSVVSTRQFAQRAGDITEVLPDLGDITAEL
jgi:hypothetical protein